MTCPKRILHPPSLPLRVFLRALFAAPGAPAAAACLREPGGAASPLAWATAGALCGGCGAGAAAVAAMLAYLPLAGAGSAASDLAAVGVAATTACERMTREEDGFHPYEECETACGSKHLSRKMASTSMTMVLSHAANSEE